jgi:Uma2 family endonuclease
VAALTHPVLSPAEFAAVMDRAGWNAPMELIEGEVVVIPPSGGEASLAQTEIIRQLAAWQTGRRADGRLLTDVFIRIGAGYLAPDAAWWAPGNEPAIRPGAIQTLPDLVIEVLSPATRANDLGAKRDLYLGAGVRELWLVDPAERSVLIVDAATERGLSAQDTITSPLLPSFAVAVGDLFA